MNFNKEKMHDISYALFWVGWIGNFIFDRWIQNNTLNTICIIFSTVFMVVSIVTAQKPLRELIQLAAIIIILLGIAWIIS